VARQRSGEGSWLTGRGRAGHRCDAHRCPCGPGWWPEAVVHGELLTDEATNDDSMQELLTAVGFHGQSWLSSGRWPRRQRRMTVAVLEARRHRWLEAVAQRQSAHLSWGTTSIVRWEASFGALGEEGGMHRCACLQGVGGWCKWEAKWARAGEQCVNTMQDKGTVDSSFSRLLAVGTARQLVC
jgi:hypothetical protein